MFGILYLEIISNDRILKAFCLVFRRRVSFLLEIHLIAGLFKDDLSFRKKRIVKRFRLSAGFISSHIVYKLSIGDDLKAPEAIRSASFATESILFSSVALAEA